MSNFLYLIAWKARQSQFWQPITSRIISKSFQSIECTICMAFVRKCLVCHCHWRKNCNCIGAGENSTTVITSNHRQIWPHSYPMTSLVPSSVKVLMNKIALWISNRGNDWPTESAIISSKYQGVKNFTLVARMQNSSFILRPTDGESSMLWRCALPAMSKTPQNMSEKSNSLLSPTNWLVSRGNNW